MIANGLKTIAQRLREYVGNPHHVDPISDAFRALIDEAANALSDASPSELTALKAELASEEQDHAELRDVVAALRKENERLNSESFEGLYNEAIGERDALREELANERTLRRSHAARIHELSDQTKDMQSSLTAAEQRNAELVELANSVLESFASYERVGEVCSFEAMPMIHASTLIELAGIAESALKPTESGASE